MSTPSADTVKVCQKRSLFVKATVTVPWSAVSVVAEKRAFVAEITIALPDWVVLDAVAAATPATTKITARASAATTRATRLPAAWLPREIKKPAAPSNPTMAVVPRVPGSRIDPSELWLTALVKAAGTIQQATSANTRLRTTTGTILPGRKKIQPSVSRTTKASARASASRR